MSEPVSKEDEMFKFQIFDFGQPQTFDINILNKAFHLWREIYAPIAESNGETLPVDYFWKSRTCMMVTTGHEIAGFCLTNFLDFRSQGLCELSYLSPASDLVKRRFQNEERKIMSIEWVTVAEKYRGGKGAVKCVDLIMGLSFQVMKDSMFDSCMGFSRTDFKANLAVQRFGGTQLELTTRHGIECGVMLMEKSKLVSHPSSETQAMIDQIYSEFKSRKSQTGVAA